MSKKIFIIEDDANILYGLQAKFSVAGFNVGTDSGISNVIEIVRKIKIFRPDFVILDLILPKIDGFELLKALKSDGESSPLVFVFTNLSDEDSKMEGLKLGVDYYFIKSDFNMDEFVGKVEKIIKNRKTI